MLILFVRLCVSVTIISLVFFPESQGYTCSSLVQSTTCSIFCRTGLVNTNAFSLFVKIKCFSFYITFGRSFYGVQQFWGIHGPYNLLHISSFPSGFYSFDWEIISYSESSSFMLFVMLSFQFQWSLFVLSL